MTELLTRDRTDETAEDFVRRVATVRRTFDARTQDSGNVSWLVGAEGIGLFVKSAGTPQVAPGEPTPHLDHAARCDLLRNAVELAHSCDHPALARLRHVVETATGPVLVYDEAPGELLHGNAAERADPASAHQRFARRPAELMLPVFDALFSLHRALAEGGWVARDLYDGCLMVDEQGGLTVIDLDTYHRGPLTNTMGRMFGSDRFMAPEEKTLGATIDQRTTVFTLGRLATHYGTRLTEDLDRFVGSPAQAAVLERACRPDPDQRFQTVAELADAWRY